MPDCAGAQLAPCPFPAGFVPSDHSPGLPGSPGVSPSSTSPEHYLAYDCFWLFPGLKIRTFLLKRQHFLKPNGIELNTIKLSEIIPRGQPKQASFFLGAAQDTLE